MSKTNINYDYKRYLIFRLSEIFKFPIIAEHFGINRTTIYYYLKTHKDLIEVDKTYQEISSSKKINNLLEKHIKLIKKNKQAKKRKIIKTIKN